MLSFIPFVVVLSSSFTRPLHIAVDVDRPPHETCLHFLSMPDLVFLHGDRKTWWGDWNANETRSVYHQLLPSYYPIYVHDYDPDVLARHVFDARRAARSYVRRRSYLPIRWATIVWDGMRNLLFHQKWNMLYEDIWEKNEDHEKETTTTAFRILATSCKTNRFVDRLCVSSTKKENEKKKHY